MTPAERQEKIDSLFIEAIALDESERLGFLDRWCANLPADFRQEIEALIEADDSCVRQPRPFLPAAKVNIVGLLPSCIPIAQVVGRRIGPYVIEKKIATGGFGSVYLGVRNDNFRQRVAIKLIRPDHGDNTNILRRFEVERQVLSDLNHPNIARLLDGGSFEDGRPYFIMEYVDGRAITDFCVAHQLDVDETLRLFQTVCQAVAHAHQFGVVHRDIKPGNILVTEDGTPKLLDFGIAKLTDLDAHRPTVLTETGQSPMTPDYASPEQLLRKPIGQTSDVFSLGVVLYELLTGVRPHRVESGLQHELADQICNVEPTKPSTAATLSRKVPVPRFGRHNLHRKKMTGDVDNIVLMSLRKEPERRYRSASQFAEDIQRHFDGLPVIARKDSVSYRTMKFARRHRVVLAAVAAILVGVSAAWLRAALLSQNLRESLYVSQMNVAFAEWQAGNLNRVRDILDAQVPQGSDSDLRGFEWQLLAHLYAENEIPRVEFESPIAAVSSHVKGRSIATLVNGKIVSMDFKTRHKTTLPEDIANRDARSIRSIAFDDKGEILALVRHTDEAHEIEVFHVVTNDKHRLTSEWPINCVDFSPDGSWIAGGDTKGNIKVWNSKTGELAWEAIRHPGKTCDGLAFSPDGKKLAAVSRQDSSLILWTWPDVNEEPKKTTISLDATFVRNVSFSPTNQQVAVAADRLNIVDFNQDEYKERVVHLAPVEYIECVSFSPDGQRIALGTALNVVEIRDANSFELLFRKSHNDRITQLFFSSDGRQLASVSDNCIKIWDLGHNASDWLYLGDGADWNDAADVSADNTYIALGDGKSVTLWNLEDNHKSTLARHNEDICDLSFSGGRRGFLAATGRGGSVTIWSLETGDLYGLPIAVADTDLTSIDLSPTEKRFVVGGEGHASLWTYEGKRHWLDPQPGWCNAVEFSADGKLLFTSGGKTKEPWKGMGYVRIWNATMPVPTRIHEFETPGMVTTLAISPDRSFLAAGDIKNFISLIDLGKMKLRSRKSGHTPGVSTLAFHPDGKLLVSGGWDRVIKIWDLRMTFENGTLKYDHNLAAIRFVQNPWRGLGLFVSSLDDGKQSRVYWYEQASKKNRN